MISKKTGVVLKAIESGVVDEVKRLKKFEKISDDPRGDLLATEEEEDELHSF